MDQAEAVMDEIETVENAPEVEEAPIEQAEPSAAEASPAEGAEDDGEIVVSIAGEAPPQEDEHEWAESGSEAIRSLRRDWKEKAREVRELKRQLAEVKRATTPQSQEAAVVVGAKPTLEACDYDADAFAEKLEQWHERKRAAEAQAKKAEEAQQQAEKAWSETLEGYKAKAKSLKVRDFAEAEETVRDVLNVTQQGVIVSGAENPALVVYALGKSPSKARELAAIGDPVKFAFAVAKLETQLKVQPRKQAPAPEKVVRAAGALPAVGAAAVEKLRTQAQQTGDYSAYLAAKRKLKG